MSSDDASKPKKSAADALPTRRTMLALVAVAVSAVGAVGPAVAQALGSVISCEVPVPSRRFAGQYTAADGSVVPPGTPGAVAPAGRPLSGEEVRVMLNGSTPPGMDPQATQAYANYIRRLQSGMSGFTCYASLMQR